ncbi:unnamed protein product [Adineta ricciae]|uniref:Uncharacterized protein n=1 Tax=Adineta ricciae TaxID=249248 RepID=A0A814ZA08_ADIRI|nr:unnamed protein product [Adineta ricciae]
MTSQIFSQGIHLIEKSDFSLLRLYIEQEVSNASLQQLVEKIQNSNDSETCFYPFDIPIRLDKCYQISGKGGSIFVSNKRIFCVDCFTEFILHQQRRATIFAQQIIYKNVKSLCCHPNQIAIRFIYDKLPPRPEFRVLSNTSQADLLSRSHPVRLSGTIIASSAVLPYIRGLKYVCHSSLCPFNDRKRQTFVLFDVEHPHGCKVGETILCEGCDLFLNEDINKRWISEKLLIAVKIKEPKTPILASGYNLDMDFVLSHTYTIIVRDEYVARIRLGGKYNFICYAVNDSHSNRVMFETLHCELLQPCRLSLPDSIRQLHYTFAHRHSFSFLNLLSTLFCPHIQLVKYCTHVKMGLILSLVSSSLHILLVGNESRAADILCQTALKYAEHGIIHRQQYPLTLASISKTKHRSFIVSGESVLYFIDYLSGISLAAGSIAIASDGITYLGSIDSLSRAQLKQLHSAFETKTLSIEVNKSEESSKIVYSVPFNSNIWAYHDSRLWLQADRVTEPTNDLSPAITDAFSLVLPLDEIEYEYEETVDNYLDSILTMDNQQETMDQQTSQWIDDIRSFLTYARTMEMPLSYEAEQLLKKYFCACRRTKRTLFSYTELPATTTDVLTQVCEAIAKCNAHIEATVTDMILAIYLFEISTMTRLGCENLVKEHYRSPPVLTDPMLIDAIEQRMVLFSQELTIFCDEYTSSTNFVGAFLKMSEDNRSAVFLRDFEPSAVRLKRKLRLILNKNLRQEKLAEKNVTLLEFIVYLILLIIATTISTTYHLSQDLFYTDRCIRRLLVNKLQLYNVKTVDELWHYLLRLNDEIYNTILIVNDTQGSSSPQILLSNENFIFGTPRLRQLRVNNSFCQLIGDLSKQPIHCHAPYHKSKEYRTDFKTFNGLEYVYTSPNTISAFQLRNKYGPYDIGGFIYQFRQTKAMNFVNLHILNKGGWLSVDTRAVLLEFIYFNPNTELFTSINILFEFLTTGLIETKDFFYTIPISSYFIGRKSWLGVFQILFLLYYFLFTFYYVGSIARYRLWFVVSSYWNVYDLALLILSTISIAFDIRYLLNIGSVLTCLSKPKDDIYKELVPFFEIQRTRLDLQAYLTALILVRLLRFLPHFSHLISNLLNVFYKSIRNSVGFLLLFFIIFMSFVVFATFYYGDELYEFHTFTLAAYTLIRCTLGQFEYDRAYRVSPTWTPIFYMLYVCIVFFVLINLFIAVINETYVLGKQEQKQIEEDIQEEYTGRKKGQRLNTFRRSKRPVLQLEVILIINHLLKLFFNKSIDLNDAQADDDDDDNDNDDDDDNESMSLEEKQTIITGKLRKNLLKEGYGQDVIEKFFQRVLGENDEENGDDNDDFSILKMGENQAIKVLYDEFKIFNNQYEKLAQDWRKTATTTRELILADSIDVEQAMLMRNHLNNLDQRFENLKTIIPNVLKSIVDLYVNRLSTNQINKKEN